MAVHWPLTFTRCLLADKSHISSAGRSSVLFEMWIPYSTLDPKAADRGNVSGRTRLTGEKDNGAVSRLLSPMEAICQQWLRLTVSSTIRVGWGVGGVRNSHNTNSPEMWKQQEVSMVHRENIWKSPPVEKEERITRCIKVIKPPPLSPPPPFPCPSPLFYVVICNRISLSISSRSAVPHHRINGAHLVVIVFRPPRQQQRGGSRRKHKHAIDCHTPAHTFSLLPQTFLNVTHTHTHSHVRTLARSETRTMQ